MNRKQRKKDIEQAGEILRSIADHHDADFEDVSATLFSVALSMLARGLIVWDYERTSFDFSGQLEMDPLVAEDLRRDCNKMGGYSGVRPLIELAFSLFHQLREVGALTFDQNRARVEFDVYVKGEKTRLCCPLPDGWPK